MPELYFDLDLCIECRSCEVACALQKVDKRVRIEVYGTFPLNLECKHCEKSPCIEVCPTNALEKRDSVVYRNEMLCVGCKSCMIACPFGNIEFTERHVVTKCDLCFSRLREGESPVCALTCPTGALKFGEREEIEVETKKGMKGRRPRELIGSRIFAWRPG